MNRDQVGRGVRITVSAVLGSATTLVLLPIAINVGTGGTAPPLLQPLTGWLWPLVGLMFLVAVALGVWDRIGDARPPKVSDRWRNQHERTSNLAAVQSYVERRRASSLFARMSVELGLSLASQPAMVQRPDDYRPDDPMLRLETLFSSGEITARFEAERRELLILGAPGGGKSTLLLRLCQELVAEAKKDEERPLPVLVDLAAWSITGRRRLSSGRLSAPQDFREWLTAELKKHYNIPPPQTRGMLTAKGSLVVLMDGLDEVSAEDRWRCVEEINKLRDECGVHIAVCCRSKDYDDLRRKLELYGAAEIKPLQRDKVSECLDDLADELSGVRTALATNPSLWDMLTTPLMFSIMALTYRGTPVSGHVSVSRLFDDYIVEMFVRKGLPSRWTPERVIRALRFLARLASSPLWNDDVAQSRLPARQAWTDLVTNSSMWRLFRRAEPAALAGLLTAFGLAFGMKFGIVLALLATTLAAAATVVMTGLLRDVPDCSADDRSGGWMWAGAGFLTGSIAGAAAYGLGMLFGSAASWPKFVAYSVTIALALVLMMLAESVLYVPFVTLIGTSVVIVVLFWTGAVEGLLVGLGAGAGLGAMAGALISGLDGVRRTSSVWSNWTCLLGVPASIAGVLMGVAFAGLAGAPAGFSLAPLIGVTLGLIWLPLVATGAAFGVVDAVTHHISELVARTMTFDELPIRKGALLRFAHDRILLIKPENDYLFAHRLLRDHLAACDPVRLSAEIERKQQSGGDLRDPSLTQAVLCQGDELPRRRMDRQ
ncbi:NACHT domain-containing protein [Streptomyces sp. ID05-26A]|nr:NACHT domain-containing protein [Streptomyces sp. ID05-26A]